MLPKSNAIPTSRRFMNKKRAPVCPAGATLNIEGRRIAADLLFATSRSPPKTGPGIARWTVGAAGRKLDFSVRHENADALRFDCCLCRHLRRRACRVGLALAGRVRLPGRER